MKKIMFWFWLFSIACVAAGIPYAFELQKDVVAKSPLPLSVLVLVSLLQTAVLIGLAIFFGNKAAKKMNLSVFSFQSGKTSPAAKVKNVAQVAIPAGIISAILIYIADLVFGKFMPQLTLQTAHVTVWKTLLASFYGGVVEEVLMRMFLMSVLALIFSKLFKVQNPSQSNSVMWSAIIVAAIMFGLGHLPATASLTAITPLVVARAVVLNGIGGIIFGWLYCKKGLEYSIVAHFTADLFLLTIIPLLIG